ncbi:DUF1559 domain-containing protein [Allorhodopirellula solitaria]|nr:DUF1559 domain-containing protein [Allorhodopirellula solitaria]
MLPLLVGLWLTCLLPGGVGGQATAADGPADLQPTAATRYIPDDAMAAAIVSPTEWLQSSMLEMFPIEIMRVQMKEQFGIDPYDIGEIKVVVSLDPATMQPAVGAIIQVTGDVDFALIREGVHARDETVQIDSHECYPVEGPPGAVIARVDEETIFYGTANMLQKMLDAENGTGKLPTLLQSMAADSGVKIAVLLDQVRPMVSQVAAQSAGNLAPDLQALTQIPGLTEAIKVQMDLRDDVGSLRVALVGTDEVAAQRIQSILIDSIAAARTLGIAEINRSLAGSGESDAMREATNEYANRMADMITEALQPHLDADEVSIETESQASIATTGVLVGLLLPAVQAARTAARRMGTSNNLKQVGLALHNYHSAYNRLPPSAITDKEGKPLLSWRVAILPFIEEQALYQKFHLDEPWDSEHNLPLAKEMPVFYDSPNVNLAASETIIQAVVGDEIGMRPLEKTAFRDILDGLSNTALVLQVNPEQAVVWSKPEDLEIDLDNPLDHLGSAERGGFYVLMGDGAVKFFTENIDPELLTAILTRAGREVIDFP